MFRIFFLFCLFFLVSLSGYSQESSRIISGIISNADNKQRIPFVHIIVDDSLHIFSDMDGNFNLPYLPQRIQFRHSSFNSFLIENPDSIPGYINLIPDLGAFSESNKADKTSELIIRNVLRMKPHNSESKKHFTYKSYNKFAVTAEKTGTTHRFFNEILRFLSYNLDKLDKTHLFLMESVSEMKQMSKIRKLETIIGIRSTGIKLPSAYTSYLHPNPFTLYNNYVSIANSKFISPLSKASWRTYGYQVTDTAFVNKDSIFVIKFFPLPGKSINTIQGIMCINSNGYALQYFIAYPLNLEKIQIQAAQEYRLTNNHWFPWAYNTQITATKFGAGKVSLHLTARSFIFDFNPNAKFNKKDFTETILEYDLLSSSTSEKTWETYRQEALTEKDLQTFKFFDSTQIQKKQEEVLKFGERVYFGKIPIGKVDLDLSKIIYTNYVEGLRLGLGFQTNQRFSKNWKLGIYAGNGLKDQKWKFGTDVAYHFNNPKDVKIGMGIMKDVYESGVQLFPFDIYQYSTEPLRKYRISILDYTNVLNGYISFRPLKYFKVNSSISIAKNTPSYNYIYRYSPSEHFNYAELSGGFRYAFGEAYIKTPENTFYVGTSYPILWFNYIRGFNNFLWGNYTYNRFDFKIQQTFKFFRFGTSGIQLVAGITTGNPPYSKLYNMRGSLRNFSVVIHNSFETMQYNEFLSDRFFAMFYSHDFGKIYTSSLLFRPNIVIVQNLGWGSLKKPGYQNEIKFSTMEKGYFESGLFLKNLLVLNFSGLRTGLGMGIFARYGPYAYKNFGDNFVFKLSVDFFI